MASTSAIGAYLFLCVLFLLYSNSDGEAIYFTTPSLVSAIQGKSVNITYIANLTELPQNTQMTGCRVFQKTADNSVDNMIAYSTLTGTSLVYAKFKSREADLTLTFSQNGIIVTCVFTMNNLNRTTDARRYVFRVDNPFYGANAPTETVVDVLVPTDLTSPNPHYITVNESDAAKLVCTATGNPEPKVNWTRHGVLVGTGVYTTDVVGIHDDKTCNYTCIAYNGIYGAKTANVCLNVQYKPRSAVVVSDKTIVCQNDNVTLTCTSGPANPAVSSYEFYNNGVLVGTSATNVSVAMATAGLPSVNKFVCVPKNLLGGSLKNGSVEVTAKVKPAITTPPKPTTVVVEGNTLSLFCNASGQPTPNITWTKVGGSTVGSGETLTISNIARGHEGTYRCTANNGNECNTVNVDATVTVNYKPENTSLSTNKSDNTFLKGDAVKLSCTSASKPPSCNVTFYHGSNPIGHYFNKTCSGGEVTTHVIYSIDGCNEETYSCKAENEYGYEESKINLTIKAPATVSISPANDLVVVEGDALQLNCTATGCPTPNITWTKTGASAPLVSGNSFFLSHQINSLSKGDTGDYVCTVDNGVVGSPVTKTIHVNVTYKPYQTNLTSTHTKACLNDSVTLTCTTNANPPAHEYRFYLNDEHVHTSSSGVYQLNVPQAGNNTYKCAPKNTVGFGVNASATVFTKAPPKITFFSPSETFVEGASVVLMCNVTGSDPMNVTLSKVGGTSYPEGYSRTFQSIGRGDEATYQCTAHNGNECPIATARSSITVIYEPENTLLTTNKSTDVFVQGESVNLTCKSSAKPAQCYVLFYKGDHLLINKSSSMCTASHVLTNIQGCNNDTFSCYAENEAGKGARIKRDITIQVPANMSVTPSTNTVVLEEGNPLSLTCTATGCPTPNITWTKNGVAIAFVPGNGSALVHPFPSLLKGDTGTYECTVDNGVIGSPVKKTIYLNVTYKPYQTNLTSTLSKACVNDSVTLECTTNANPPAHEYRFYLNGQLVHSSSSGVYLLNVPQAGNNTYKCEPKNTIGFGVNASVEIRTKAPPKIYSVSPNNPSTFVEGTNVVFMCNVTGSDPMTVTWSKVGGSSYPEGYSHSFQRILRGDEATYQCIANNGNECPAANANTSITVIYKPENTNITMNKSNNVFLQGEAVTLTCRSSAKPSDCRVLFYQGNSLLVNTSSSTCTASHVIPNIQGCNDERFSCLASNEAGEGEKVYQNVTVRVPPGLSLLPSSDTVVKVEGESLFLNCTATGCPTPNITWTKNGVTVPLIQGSQSVLSHHFASLAKDNTGTYQCTVNNGVVGSPVVKTIYLNVTYKPYKTNLTSTLIKACLNDSVTLTCTTNANPPAHEYRFYLNDKHVHTSSSGVYQLNVPQAGNNTYKCAPKNTIGFGVNASVTIKTKAPTNIIWVSPNKTAIEGNNVVLMCNVTGSNPINVTWSEVGGLSYPEGYSRTFQSIVRGDEATYQCTAHNGNECPIATARSSITVIYKPENTNLTINKSSNAFVYGEAVTLTCQSEAKPSECRVLFYQGNSLLGNTSSSSCTASHVIPSIQGCNDERFSCFAFNEAGEGERVYQNVTVKVPARVSLLPSDTVVKVEGEPLFLNCTATGCPSPNSTWKKIGETSPLKQGSESVLSYHFGSLTKDDTGTYQCTSDNGVVGSPFSKTVYVNVTYKPYQTNLTSNHSKTCLSDPVALECTSNANPPAHEYRFYLNDQLVHTSSSGVYQLNVPQAGNNTYKCAPKNTVGYGQNATVTIRTKAPPKITFFSQSETFVEGASVVLMCNVTGSDPMNVTLSKVGGTSYPEGYSRTFQSIGRGDEATYQCTAYNGEECPVATVQSSITVIYKPESTQLSLNKSDNILMVGEAITLTCQASAKPSQCNITFYEGSQLLANKPSSACTAYHIIPSVQGCNEESFSCVVENKAGRTGRVYKNVTVQVPSTISLIPDSESVTLEEGTSLNLNCTATGCPSPNITWSKDGEAPIMNVKGHTLVHNFGGSLGKGDTGTYTCTVNNGVSGNSISKSIYVNVTYKPHKTNLTSNTSSTCVNDPVTLTCNSNANPNDIDYLFYINDELVHTTTSGFYKFNAAPAGRNVYTCRPKNTIGFGINETVSIITKAQPVINSLTPNQTVVEGYHLMIICNISGSEPLNVTLSKSDGTHKQQERNLTLPVVNRNDEGEYICTVNNGDECLSVSSTTSVTVNYKPENTTLTTSTDVACLNDKMTLTCRTEAKPPAHKYKFYRNGVFIADTSAGNYTYNMNVNGTNTYTCEPINSAGNGTKANVTVQVKVSPVIVSINKSQAIIEGTTDVSLVCDVFDQSGNLNVSWHKVGGGQVSSTNSYTISVINRNDSGSYECKAHNGNECPIKKNVTKITVTYPPFITEVKPSNQTVSISEHEEIWLTCKVSGNPKPIVNWTRNGVLINFQGEEYKFNGVESLSGNYTCIAYNGIGANQNKTFGVTINGYCKNHQCKHGSTCKTKALSYICLCKRGLTGQFCDIEDPIDIHYDVILIIDKQFVEDFKDVASAKSKTDIKDPICTKIFNIFNFEKPIPNRWLIECLLKKLSEGSVISNTELTFNGSVLRSEILERINAGIEKINDTYKFGNLTLKSSEVKVDRTTDACSSEPCKFNSKCLVEGVGYKCECDNFRYGTHCENGIGFTPGLIIILACILIIIIAIILICLYCQRKKTNTYPSGNVAIENGTQMKVRGDHPEAANNVAIQDENKVNGEPTGTYRPDQTITVKQPDIQQNHTDDHDVTYAELSFTKNYDPQNEKTQTFPKEKTETIYSDIVSVMKNTDEKPEEKIKLEEEGIEMKEKEQAELEEEGTEMKEKEQNEDQETKKDNTNEDTQQTDDPSSTGAETKPEAGGENNMPDNPSLNTSTSIDEKAV